MSWRQWSITVVLFAAVLSVVGQTTPVTQCISTFDWTINSLGQTPCLVAAYLESACGVPTIVPAVPVGNHYLGPNGTQADPCRCSSVTYSAISACAGCQDRTYIDWLTWSLNCPAVSLTTFPASLPPAVVVPLWAFLDVTQTNNNFSVLAAEQNASATLTTSSAVTTGTRISNSLTSSGTASTSPTSASPTSTGSSSSARNSKSNAGAIAGGVVGGIGFVAFVGLGTLWFCLRRKRNKVQQNVAFDRRALVSGTGMSQTNGSTQHVSPFVSQPNSQPSQSIYTSDVNSSLYPGSLYTTRTPAPMTNAPPTGSGRSAETMGYVPPSAFQFGPEQTTNVIPRGYTGRPEV